MAIRKNVPNATQDIILTLMQGCAQLSILLAKRLIIKRVRASHVIMDMFQKMENAILTLLYQDRMLILIALSFKATHVHNATKDTLLPQTMYVHKSMFCVRLTQKTTVTVHLVIQVTSSRITNASPLKIFTFLSVKQLVRMANVLNVKIDTSYQTMLAYPYPYFVILSINRLENVLHVQLGTFFKMMNVFIQRLVLIQHVLIILILTVHNVNQGTFYKIISAHKLIQNVQILITQKIFVKNVTTQIHRGPIVSERINTYSFASRSFLYYLLPFHSFNFFIIQQILFNKTS